MHVHHLHHRPIYSFTIQSLFTHLLFHIYYHIYSSRVTSLSLFFSCRVCIISTIALCPIFYSFNHSHHPVPSPYSPFTPPPPPPFTPLIHKRIISILRPLHKKPKRYSKIVCVYYVIEEVCKGKGYRSIFNLQSLLMRGISEYNEEKKIIGEGDKKLTFPHFPSTNKFSAD